MTEKLTTYVKVKHLNRSIEYDEIPTWTKPSEQLEISATMMNILSGCTLQWRSIHNLTQNEINEKYKELNISQTVNFLFILLI